MDDKKEEDFESIGLFWGLTLLVWMSLFGLILMISMTVISVIELAKIAFDSTKDRLSRLSRD